MCVQYLTISFDRWRNSAIVALFGEQICVLSNKKCGCANDTSDYLVTRPLAFGYADVGLTLEVDTLRRVVTPTSGFEDFILKVK